MRFRIRGADFVAGETLAVMLGGVKRFGVEVERLMRAEHLLVAVVFLLQLQNENGLRSYIEFELYNLVLFVTKNRTNALVGTS